MFGSIFYIINELDRNIRNHAGLSENDYYKFSISLCDNFVSISLCDAGIGIEESLKKVNTDKLKDILIGSTQLGVSAHSNWEFASIDSRNSGFGLFMVTELAMAPENGFELKSGYFGLSKLNRHKAKYLLSKPIKGTTIKLKLDCTTLNIRINAIQENCNIKSKKSDFNSKLNDDVIRIFYELLKETL